jgi:NADH-quinone oxidoreductase subunit E
VTDNQNLMELSQDTCTKIDEVILRYPEKRSAALMVIHLIQDELGSISDESCCLDSG